METRRTLLVDAFTDEPLAGNVAGVVPDAAGLSSDQMRRIAAELGASETAFVFDAETDGDGADERIRYFTPTTEIDLCGHATIATYAALHEEDAIGAGERTLRTNVGELTITVDDGTVWMRQHPPTVDTVDEMGAVSDRPEDRPALDADRLGDALGIDPAALRDIGADLPVAVASTGLPWLVVPVNFLERLGEAEPNTAAVEAISETYEVAGIYAFTFDTLDAESTLHGRAFAPAVGVTEDPVTGTASGAVGGYLRAVGAFDGDFPETMRFEQGHFVDRPGHVQVRVGGESGADGDSVVIGGHAVVSLDGDLCVPDGGNGDGGGESGDDGIIEI
jgi:PhzF family phenazine biosynthesis protein